MVDKTIPTPLLLNGQVGTSFIVDVILWSPQAACLIGQGKFEDAESLLQEALEKVQYTHQLNS